MSLVKSLKKYVKVHHILVVVGLGLLALTLYQTSSRKTSFLDNLDNLDKHNNMNKHHRNNEDEDDEDNNNVNVAKPANPMGQNEEYHRVDGGMNKNLGLVPCNGNEINDPSELLPKDVNNEWAKLNPSGNGDFNNVNLLKAGYLNGIDTVGNSLRNANLQVRSEPPNPTSKVSPWMNTTIEPDLMRTPLELGCGEQ